MIKIKVQYFANSCRLGEILELGMLSSLGRSLTGVEKAFKHFATSFLSHFICILCGEKGILESSSSVDLLWSQLRTQS